MKKLYKFLLIVPVAALLAISCSDDDDNKKGPEYKPVITYASNIYYGEQANTGTESSVILLYSQDVSLNGLNQLSGKGIGIRIALNGPVKKYLLPTPQTYQLQSGTTYQYTFDKGVRGPGMIGGTYVYYRAENDSQPKYTLVTNGTITITEASGVYSIKADVTDDEGNSYNYEYNGATLDTKTGSLSNGTSYYFGDFFGDGENDNYTLVLYSPGITESAMTISGTGTALMLDLTAKEIKGNLEIPANTYAVMPDYGPNSLLAMRLGSWGLEGSGIYIMENSSTLDFIWINSGQMILEKLGDNSYYIDIQFKDPDNNPYNYKYIGPIEKYDPFGLATTRANSAPAKTYKSKAQYLLSR